MNCPNCGTNNNAGFKFCIKCGQSLIDEPINNTQINDVQATETPHHIEQSIQQTSSIFTESQVENINNSQTPNEKNFNQINQTVPNVTPSPHIQTEKLSFMNYFFVILAVILKPFRGLKEELSKFNEFKNSAMMSLIISGTATLINLITTMLSVVIEKRYKFGEGLKTTWVWENLKELNYIEIIGKNFLIYLGSIAAIAGIYYIASLIVKKQSSFSRLLGLSAIAITPLLICSLVLSPLLSLIWAELAMPITIIGLIYTIILIYEGINSEIILTGDIKYYFNLICLSILGIAAYYLYMKLFMTSVSSGLDSILDLFN